MNRRDIFSLLANIFGLVILGFAIGVGISGVVMAIIGR